MSDSTAIIAGGALAAVAIPIINKDSGVPKPSTKASFVAKDGKSYYVPQHALSEKPKSLSTTGQSLGNVLTRATTEELKKKWDSLTDEAKCAAARELNKQLKTNIDCKKPASFQTISKAVAGAAGAAGCTALGVSAPLAPACAIVGGAIGGAIAPFVEKGIKKVGSALVDGTSEVGEFLGKAGKKIFGGLF